MKNQDKQLHEGNHKPMDLLYRTISFTRTDFHKIKERQRQLAQARGAKVTNSEALSDLLIAIPEVPPAS